MPTIARTKTDIIGTPASPASIAATATTSGTLDHTATVGAIDVSIGLAIIAGASPPTTAITIRFFFTEDGTNYLQDGADISLSASGSITYTYRYEPPFASKGSKVTIVNGNTNAITAWCQGSVLSVT